MDADDLIPPSDRWRLILGQERDRLRPRAMRAGVALDELYGAGRHNKRLKAAEVLHEPSARRRERGSAEHRMRRTMLVRSRS